MAYTHPGRLFVQQHGTVETVDDVMRYVAFLRASAGLDETPPIDLEKIYAHFEMPIPKRAPLPNQQGLLLNPERGLIIINANDPDTRQRFTEAHELMELLFDALPSQRGWASHQKGAFKHTTKERLCDEGAACLLMPPAHFGARIRSIGVSFETARQLVEEFQVSMTAALVQMARVGPGRCAVVLWRMKHKPSEVRAQPADEQLALFGNPAEAQPAEKLRVEWSLRSTDMPHIPTHKSIPEDSSIFRAWADGVFTSGDERLDLGGAAHGRFRCENQPFTIEDDIQVLSLLQFFG